MQIQTRDDEGRCIFHSTFQEAFDHAQAHPSVWKISWDSGQGGKRIRLVRVRSDISSLSLPSDMWTYSPLLINQDI